MGQKHKTDERTGACDGECALFEARAKDRPKKRIPQRVEQGFLTRRRTCALAFAPQLHNVFKVAADGTEGLPVELLPFSPRQQRRVVDVDGGSYGATTVPLNFDNFVTYGLVPANVRLVHVILPDLAGKFSGEDGVDMRFFDGIPGELLKVDATAGGRLGEKKSGKGRKERRGGEGSLSEHCCWNVRATR